VPRKTTRAGVPTVIERLPSANLSKSRKAGLAKFTGRNKRDPCFEPHPAVAKPRRVKPLTSPRNAGRFGISRPNTFASLSSLSHLDPRNNLASSQ
jgi:hypothetical protein